MTLSSDALTDVLRFLEAGDMVKTLQVSKQWHSAAMESPWTIEERDLRRKYSLEEEDLGWMQLNVTNLVLETPYMVEGVLRLLPSENAVTSLKVTCELTPADWQHIAEKLPQLTSLDIQVFAPPSGTEFHSLEALSVNAIPKSADWAVIPSSLTSLSVSHTTDAQLAAHMPRLKNLSYLSLASCDEITQTGFVAIANNSKSLTSIDLSSTRIDAYALDLLLKSATRLRTLSLQDCTALSDTDGFKKKSAPKTKVQHVANLFAELKAATTKVQTHVPSAYRDEEEEDAEGKDSAGFLSAGLGSLLSKHVGLESLSLGGVGMLDDCGVRMILKSLKNLRCLKLNKNREITDDAFSEDLPRNLDTLSLSSCIQLTDQTLKAVSVLPLRSLSVSGCFSMTPNGVRLLGRECPKLRSFWAFSMMSEGIQRSSDLPAQGIKLFNDETLRDFLEHVPDLQSLGLSFESNITEAAFPAKPYTSLTYLNLQYCCASNATYQAVADTFPNLVRLNIQSKAVPVETEVMKDLLAKLPHLTTIRACVWSIEPLLPLIKERKMHTIDLEYAGNREAFAMKAELWWDFVCDCKNQHVNILLGNRASHYLND